MNEFKVMVVTVFFFFSSRRRHTRCSRDWSSDVCSSDLQKLQGVNFVVADGDLFAAITAGSFQDFGPAKDIYDVSAILSPDTGLANVLANFSDPKADGRETVGGVATVRVTGNVSADAVNKIAPQIAATGPVPSTAWIQEDGTHQLVQAKLEPSQGNSVTMTL